MRNLFSTPSVHCTCPRAREFPDRSRVVRGAAALAAAAVFLFGWSAPALPAFTIQTGTFVPAAAAEGQFRLLAAKLPAGLREFLRIEKGDRYFVVRTGAYSRFDRATAALENIRPSIGDAFILNLSEDSGARIHVLFPDIGPRETSYWVEAGPFATEDDAVAFGGSSFETPASPSAPERAVPRFAVQHAGDAFSVRIGPFPRLDQAWPAFLRARWDNVPAVLTTNGGLQSETTRLTAGPGAGNGPAVTGQPKATMPSRTAVDATAPPTVEEQVAAVITEMSALVGDDAYEDAALLLEDAITRLPDSHELHAWHGSVLMSLGDHEQAREAYTRAAELEPGVPEYRSAAGYSLIQLYRDNALEAIEQFGRALDIDPGNVYALEGLGTVYVSMGERERAREVAERLRENDPAAAGRLDELIEYGIDWTPRD